MFLDDQGNLTDRSVAGHPAAGVPGSVAGMWEAHRRFGSVHWGELVQPAINFADGIVVHERLAGSLQSYEQRLRGAPAATALLPEGRVPRVTAWCSTNWPTRSVASDAIPGPPGVTLLQNAALSPDGRQIVFFTNTNNAAQLWRRSLDSLEMTPIDGAPPSVSAGAPPFFSPDSRQIAFWDGADRKLKRLPVDGGVPQTICDAPNYAGGTWMAEGTIVFGTRGAGLFRVPASGATPQLLTTLAAGEAGHINPSAFPDGRHVLYHVASSGERRGVYLTTIDGGNPQLLLDTAAAGDQGGAVYVPPSAVGSAGHLVYRARPSAAPLMARPLDPVTFAPAGDDRMIAQNVAFFSVSPAGVLAYLAGNLVQGAESRLVWMTRDGREVARVGPAGNYQDLRLSPDGRRAVYSQRDASAGPYDIWVMDLARGVPSRVTREASDERFPAWSADGASVFFGKGVGRAHSSLVRQDVNGGAQPEVLLDGARDIFASDASRNGQFLLYRDVDASGSTNLLTLPLSADQRRPSDYLAAAYDEAYGTFMPSGSAPPRWVAYASTESGRSEVYVQSFPAGSGKLQVSSDGGGVPRWRADGRELYFASGGRLMAVPVTLGQQLEIGVATPLFQVGRGAGGLYDVGPDGRFLVVMPVESDSRPPAPQIAILTNWQRTLSPARSR